MFDKEMRTGSIFKEKTGIHIPRGMLRFAALLFLISVLVFSGGCFFIFGNEGKPAASTKDSVEVTLHTDETESPDSGAAQATSSAVSDSTSANTVTAVPGTPAATSAESTAAASGTAAATVSSTAPVNTANMYSSYAILTSFDPSTGVASFDYFDMLRGEAAIDWLVEEEGYTREEAEDIVNNFADSEFVFKNTNPQLRYANMSIVTIKMMYNPDGSDLYNSVSVPFTYDQFCTLYAAHPELVANSPFFYYCTVTGGAVTGVEQIYWP
jgi:hypothetical protein